MTGVNFSRSLKASAIAAVAMGACVSLSACQESPSAAAEVGGHRISVDDVQVVSRALCAERQSAPAGATGGPAALSQVEDQALQALVSARLTDQFTHGAAVDETELNQQLSQVQPLIDRLPADQQEKAHDLISQIFVGQIRLTDVGIKMAGGAKVQADQAYALGVQARAAFDKKVDVVINPRFRAQDATGRSTKVDDQAMSTPVSSMAKGATATDANWAVSLPAALRCG